MSEYTVPHRENAALLTIDVQNDFTLPDAPATISGTMEAVPRMQRVVEACRAENLPVVHVVRLYKSDGSNVDMCRRALIESGNEVVRPGTDGAELVQELKPSDDCVDADRLLGGEFQEVGDSEWLMYKPRWSAFYRTDLDDFLNARSVDTVIVCGCNFPNCPRTTIYEASARDYRIVFVPDATSRVYSRGIDELENIGVTIMELADAVEWVSG